MIDFPQLLLLGAVAGFTIFLGLPLAVLQNVNPQKKGFLNALAIGILLFLIIDVFSHAWQTASSAAADAFAGKSATGDAALDLLGVFGGIAIGLLGLVVYETRYMKSPLVGDALQSQVLENRAGGGASGLLQHTQTVHEISAYKLAMMIAIGIGAHNFSEGLAIGQSYASGSIRLAVILVIGFGAHNATEGFGIASPLTRLVKKPSPRFLALAGIVGGGPTFLGTLVGSLWVSNLAYVLFLSIAGGALVYVSMLMYSTGRRQTTNGVLMVGIFVGLCAGFLTDLVVTLGGA